MPFLGFPSPFKSLPTRTRTSSAPDSAGDEDLGPADAATLLSSTTGSLTEPLQLVELSEGKFVVNAEALDVIRCADGDVAVISCCGRSRQGKSFLLNNLLRKMFEVGEDETFVGFRTSGSTEPCTKGLYLWPEALTGTKDGRKLSVFLVDSEGIDSYDQTINYSAEIFSMAILLSSVFVYNSMGAIDESAIDKLSLVCELTRLIRSTGGDVTEEGDTSDEMPSLIWLLRDFFLDFEDGSAEEYLEKALRTSSSTSSSSSDSGVSSAQQEQRDSIRDAIKGLFPQRDCLAMVRPHTNERCLRKLDALKSSELREEFRNGVESLYQKILNQVRPKRFGDRRLDGPMLASLVELYVKAINNGAVPTIASAWQGVAEMQCQKAVRGAIEMYREGLESSQVRASEVAMRSHHEDMLREAMIVFDKMCAGGSRLRSTHRNELAGELNEYFEGYKARRYLEAEISCLDSLKDAEARMKDLVQESKDAELQEWIEDFVADYSANQEGLSKFDLLCKFLLTCMETLIFEKGARQRGEVEELERQLTGLKEKHSSDMVKKEAAMATLKEVLLTETQSVRIMLNREKARNKRLAVKTDTLQKQLESSNSSVQCSAEIVDRWAKEAAMANSELKTPPKQQCSLDMIETGDDPVKTLCSKFKKTSMRDITNHNGN